MLAKTFLTNSTVLGLTSSSSLRINKFVYNFCRKNKNLRWDSPQIVLPSMACITIAKSPLELQLTQQLCC